MVINNCVRLALVGLVALAFSAQALVFELDTPLPGKSLPSGDPPWLTITITPSGDDVEVRFDANLGSQKIGKAYLNFNPQENVVEWIAFGGLPSYLQGIALGSNQQRLDGDGYFDILFDFKTGGDPFDDNDWFSLTLEAKAGKSLEPWMFDFTSELDGLGYKAGAHVQGLPGGDSTWIVPGPGVPEASMTAALLGFALLAIGSVRRSLSK